MKSMRSPGDERATFGEAFDDAPIGMALVEIDRSTGGLGGFLAVNRALCTLGDRTREELLDVSPLSLVHTSDRDETERLLKLLRAGEVSSFDAELRLLRAGGETIWGAVTASLIRDSWGRPCVLAHIQDITDRKTAEAGLRASERRYRQIIETTHEGVWMIDAEQCTTFVNQRMVELMGRTEDEMLGTPLLAFMDEEMQAEVTEMFRHGLPGQHGQVEVRFIRGDGSDLWGLLSTSELLADDGVHVGAVAMVSDITEQKRADAELRRRVQREGALATLVRRALDEGDLADLMQAGVDLCGAVLAADVCRVVERAPDARTFIVRAVYGESPPFPVGAELPHDPGSLTNHTLRENAPVRVDDLRDDPRFTDRSLIDDYGVISGVSVPIRQGGFQFGELAAHSVAKRRFTTDDTNFLERVANVLAAAVARSAAGQLETQLRQAQRLEAVGQLAGGIAHDFNNLLSVILNSARLAMDDLGEDSPGRPDMEAIVQAGERAAELTRQLLLLSREDDVQPTVVDMNSAVRDATTLLERTLGANIDVVGNLDPDLWPVSVGAGQIEQVLINLAVNGRDAMPGGGSLQITTANVVLDAMAASQEWAVPAGAYVRLTVLDTGHGMDPEVAARAFDPFFTTKPTGYGTGLGLATVCGIAKRAGGYVDIHSEPGFGTAVTLFLPVRADDERAVRALTASILGADDGPRRSGAADVW